MSEASAGGRPGPILRACRAAALIGGALLIATSLLTTVSVLKRWAVNDPIRGDFELVSLGSGVAVLALLAYGTAQRTNIMVDTFTTWLPRRVQLAMDGFWNLVWGVVAIVLAERMVLGAQETLTSHTQTMVLGLPTWWAVGIGVLAFALTGLAALAWAFRLFGGRADG
ncbi:TRAP transporter small permease [Muricoccus radiodurans]|uniref:TRAP transporter small permease n=1 Tax=Muricoccus radiodurans TaxID=2231721 RepID=UPI003CF3203F